MKVARRCRKTPTRRTCRAAPGRRTAVNYHDARARREILLRQRRELWTPEQVESLARHFRLKPGMKLLDAGCGYGYVMRAFGPYCLPGGKLVGLDRERKLLAGAARFARNQGLTRASSFAVGDICRMPFPDNAFDVTIAHVVFCHLKEPEKALDEMIRVTRRGGCVAVFDNARTVPGTDWQNIRELSIAERAFLNRVELQMLAGRKKLGHGDFAVGCYVPWWMEARGLRDVDARTNDRVVWIAPPYSSPAQRVAYQSTKERLREFKPGTWLGDRTMFREMRAGGCSEAAIRKARRIWRRDGIEFLKAFWAGTIASAYSGPFWCIWGFKP